MYLKKTTIAGPFIRVEKYHASRAGKGKPRARHQNKTAEDVAAVNQRRAEQKLLDLIRCNFQRGRDAHVILTYSGEPPDQTSAKKDKAKFIRRLRREYQGRGDELKYINVTEYESSRIHHHFLINKIKNADAIINAWQEHGIAHIIVLYSQDFEQLGDYLLKETSVRKDPEGGYRRRWSCSQNLIKPKIKIERIHSKNWKRKPPDQLKREGRIYLLVHGATKNTLDINDRPIQSVLYRQKE